MISTVEKALILKEIELFSRIPGEDLAQILAEAAMQEGHEVVWIPSYGPEMRRAPSRRSSTSWNASLPIRCLGTWPVMTIIGMESI